MIVQCAQNSALQTPTALAALCGQRFVIRYFQLVEIGFFETRSGRLVVFMRCCGIWANPCLALVWPARNRTNQRARDPDYGQISEWLQFALSTTTYCAASYALRGVNRRVDSTECYRVRILLCLLSRSGEHKGRAISATGHHTAPHCGWAQFASSAVRSVCGRRQRPAGVVMRWMSWWRSDLGFAHASLCALRSSVWSARNQPLSDDCVSLVGGRISCFLACRRPSPQILNIVAVSIL